MTELNVFSPSRKSDHDSSIRGYDIESISEVGLVTGYVNVRYNGKLYHIKAKQSRGYLFMVKKNPGRYTIFVQGDIEQAYIDETGVESGMADMTTIIGDIVDNNTIIESPNVNRNMQFTSDTNAGDPTSLFFDETPGVERRNFDQTDITSRTSEAATRSAFFVGPGGAGMAGPGKNVVSVDSDGNIGLYNAGSLSMGGDEVNHGVMTSTSLNPLQHYFIGIANAVALPMPHMINLPKLLTIGSFINKIATSAKHVKSVFS